MANEVVEKIYEKIDKELGEQHVEEVVKNLMVSENNEDASRQLMELHKQVCIFCIILILFELLV